MSGSRWLRFNVIGIMGFMLQTGTLWTLVHWSGLPATVSVAIAVLVAVSHNFLWHERYTWRDRPRHERARRWLSFNMSTNIFSLFAQDDWQLKPSVKVLYGVRYDLYRYP